MANGDAAPRRVVYDDAIVRAFALATLAWGAAGILLGVVIATQLAFWQANLGPWLNFGRLRPLHTNVVIFAFVGNLVFGGIYYSTQRLLKVRLASDLLSRLHFWGWQLIIVAAAVTLPLGLTQGREYAELIWPIDLAIAVVWALFGVNFFLTLARRNEPGLYISLWFYIATIVAIALLHLVNSLQLPDSLRHSYPVYAGVQDALVQWWYGHNLVAFLLTMPILGVMYYFLPQAAGRPLYSYRLAVVHFWSLVFIYIWAGPHHLLYTALPDWAQTLGVIFSILLWAPSWGGTLNGLLTLRGAWRRLRGDPVLGFFAVAVIFYGLATSVGPLLSVPSVNALGHYTDWIIGHVHAGVLGWNGCLAFGLLYWLVPRLWGRELRWPRLAGAHLWIATVGILLYVVSMWISGVREGLYWRALDADGFLKNPDFLGGLLAARPLYHTRLLGGLAYLAGFVLMLVNLGATIRAGAPATVTVAVSLRPRAETAPTGRLLTGAPVLLSLVIFALALAFGASGIIQGGLFLTLLLFATIAAVLILGRGGARRADWQRRVEGNPLAFTLLVLAAVLAGSLVEIVPTLVTGRRLARPAVLAGAEPAAGSLGAGPAAVDSAAARVAASPWRQRPYTALEQEGRDLYVREGCYLCHSQMIRPFRHETLRYGDWSRAEESMYDHPFQWGSKRTGPDLARVGVKYANEWHYLHLMDPRQTSHGSIMPSFAFLKAGRLDLDHTAVKLQTLARLGVPYGEADRLEARGRALDQGGLITADVARQGVQLAPDSELTAVIAYLQRLGRPSPPPAAVVAPRPEVRP